MTNDTTDLALKFVAKYYPESKVVMLAGSQADSSAALGSDIDLGLTSSMINEVLVDTLYDFDTRFDVVVFPENDIEYYLGDFSSNRDAGPILSYLAKSKIIKDDTGIGKHIIETAEYHFYKGYNDSQSKYAFTLEKMIKQQYNYLSRITNETDRVIIINYIIDIFSGLLVMANFGWYINPGKWRIKLLKLIDNDFYRLIDAYYKNTAQQEQVLLTWIKNKLSKIINDYHERPSRFDETTLYQPGHLIISFTANLAYFEFINIVLLSTGPQSDKFYFYPDKSKINIVFYDLEKDEQNVILKAIRHALNSDASIIYSYQILNHTLPKIHYGGPVGFALAEQIFSSLAVIIHKLLYDKKLNAHNQFAYAAYFYIVFLKSTNFSKKAFKEFSAYLYNRLIVTSYDLNYTLKYNNIANHRTNLESNFEKIFNVNKEQYIQIFGPLLKKWSNYTPAEDWLNAWAKNIKEIIPHIFMNNDLELSYIRKRILAVSTYSQKADEWLIYEKLLDTCFSILNINVNDRPFLIYAMSKLI